MASDARNTIRKAYADTSNAIGRLVPTLFLTCISTVILGGTDDHVLLSGGEVSTPFVGKTRYEIFMVIAPISIVVLRIYIELQLRHLDRLGQVVRRHKIRRPITLGAENSPTLLLSGVVALHVVPPAAIAFLGRHASAVFPAYGICLYALAIFMTLWSAAVLFERARPAVAIASVSFPLVFVAVAGLILHNDFMAGDNQRGSCGPPFEGVLGQLAEPFLRQVELEGGDFSKQDAENAYLQCGHLDRTTWSEAMMVRANLTGAGMHSANFRGAILADADFGRGLMGDATLTGAKAFGTQFNSAELNNAVFEDAELWLTSFAGSDLMEARFDKASIRNVGFYQGDLLSTRFVGAEIRYSDFSDADLSKANFTGAFLFDVEFYSARLSDVRFNQAVLDIVTFSPGADENLNELDLTCTSFADAILKEVNFEAVPVEQLRLASFEGARLLGVIWPAEGFDPATDPGRDYNENCEGTP